MPVTNQTPAGPSEEPMFSAKEASHPCEETQATVKTHTAEAFSTAKLVGTNYVLPSFVTATISNGLGFQSQTESDRVKGHITVGSPGF
jgi:hypothetical protein